MNCILCAHPMEGPFGGYWFECRRCTYLASDLKPAIGEDSVHRTIDEPGRRHSLRLLRQLNFEKMLDQLAPFTSALRPAPQLLDVGCAHGWFLEAAMRRGYRTIGLEPDPLIAREARGHGLEVTSGFFPDALPEHALFDVITFNDVFEHLPDPLAAANACVKHLAPSGLLVITLPSSKGILFRIARLLDRFGVHGPLDRLWQRGFPSPHLSYFNPPCLATLLRAHGLREVVRDSLPSFTREGLWERLRYDRRSSPLLSVALYVMLYGSSPIFALLPPDISFQVFQPVRQGEQDCA